MRFVTNEYNLERIYFMDTVQINTVKCSAPRYILPGLLAIGISLCAGNGASAVTFPGENWEQRTPAEMSLDPNKLDRIAAMLGSSGCII